MTVVGKERLPSRGCDLKYIYIFLNIYIFLSASVTFPGHSHQGKET